MEGTETKTNPRLKLFFHVNWSRRPVGRVGVWGKMTWVVLLIPELSAQGQGETLLEQGRQSPGVSCVNGWPMLPIASVSGPVGRSH